MLTFKRILFPVDFSTRCLQTAGYVADVARRFKSELALLHVCEIENGLRFGSASSSVAYEAYKEAILQDRTSELQQFGYEEFKGLSVRRDVETGDAASVIKRYAIDHEIDLIMIPTHGHGKFRQLLLGSVTAKVLYDVKLPVWTTAHSDQLAAGVSKGIQNIVCAIDLRDESLCVIKAASDVAQEYRATVTLVHAIAELTMGSDELIREAPFQQFLFDNARKRLDDLKHKAGVDFSAEITQGGVAEVVRNAATQHKAELVVIGRGSMGGFLGRLRTSATAIIRNSPCPVLSI